MYYNDYGIYYDEMTEDIKNYIDENIDQTDWKNDRCGLEQELNDKLFCEDSVTGNASGSYYFNSYKSQSAVLSAPEALKEAISEFDIDNKTVADKFLNGDYEYFDVTIRCYLLGIMISEVLDELDENGFFSEEEVEEDNED